MNIHPLSLGCLSLFFPGSGQLLSGRPGKAIYFAALALFMWVISMGFFGWIIHICAAFDAWGANPTPTSYSTPEPEPLEATPVMAFAEWDEDPEENIVWH